MEAAPAMEEERVLKVQRSQHVNTHTWWGGDRRSVMTTPTVLGGAGGQDGDTSSEATSEVAALQRREWTVHQTQHGRGSGHFGVEYRQGRRRSSTPLGGVAKDNYGDESQKAPKN